MSDVQYERLTGDGDAGGLLQAKGQAFIALAETIRESVDCLSKIEDEDSTKSEAMTKLRDLARTVRQDIEKASGLYHIVGEQITGYRLALETAKAVADPAADEIDNLNGHLGARQTAATDASAAYITARNNLATAKLPWTQPPTGETKEQWITQLGNTASDRWSAGIRRCLPWRMTSPSSSASGRTITAGVAARITKTRWPLIMPPRWTRPLSINR